MRVSARLVFAALALGLFFAPARPAPGAAGQLETPGVALPIEFPAEARMKIQQALQRKDCKFLGGNWVNSHTSLRYAGETKALNLFLDELSKCPGTSVHVALRRLTTEECDWRVSHGAFKGFQVEVNLLSKRIDLEQLYIPELRGPALSAPTPK